jgi:sugar fermentation stimulation protein A
VVTINDRDEYAHLPNTGRQKELLTPGRRTILSVADNPERKTKFTIRAVKFSGRWVCVDSQVANHVAAEMARANALPLFDGYTEIKQEHTIGKHRFDLLCKGDDMPELVVEVKLATLVSRGVAAFPDAPTIRGTSHVKTLAQMSRQGNECAVLFVAQRSDARSFAPNRVTDPDFADALLEAQDSGVIIKSVRCRVSKKSITLIEEIEVNLL